ncbi:MAG: hypothetical protein ABIO39_14560 [Caulobacteraceae bacterium]
MNASLPLSRRGFGYGLAGAAATLAAPTGVLAKAAPTMAAPAAAAPVVAFHMDAPYIDWTGMAEPYRPPAGLRSGQALAHLADHELHGLHGWA